MRDIGSATTANGISHAVYDWGIPGPPPRSLLAVASEVQYPYDPRWADRALALEDALVVAINADRTANGLAPVKRDPALDVEAVWKASQCAWALYLDHTDHIPVGELGNPSGAQVDRPFGGRFQDLGYVREVGYEAAFGENLAYGFTDAKLVEQAFMSDVGHRDNVLGRDWVGVGIGVAVTNQNCAPGLTPQPGLVFWCQDFGTRPVGVTPPPVTPPPVTPPPPHDVPIVKDAIWRNKAHHAQRVQITRTVAAADPKVYFHILRSGLDRHVPQTAFRANFELTQ